MKVPAGVLIVMLLATACQAQKYSAEQLRQMADQSTGHDCARAAIQAASATLEDANKSFEVGKVKDGHDAADTMLRYVQRSVDCSLETHKQHKDIEIDLRRLIHRTGDIEKTLDSDDQAHFKQIITGMEQQRDRLLFDMFGAVASRGETAP